MTILQGVIARECHISEDKQVLLISGGETLDPAARVGKYHAGTVSINSYVLGYCLKTSVIIMNFLSLNHGTCSNMNNIVILFFILVIQPSQNFILTY